jgi:hypothetical protein
MRHPYTQGCSGPFKIIFKHMFKHFGKRNKLELIGLRNKYKFDHERLRDIEEVKNTTKSQLKRVLDRESKLEPFRMRIMS